MEEVSFLKDHEPDTSSLMINGVVYPHLGAENILKVAFKKVATTSNAGDGYGDYGVEVEGNEEAAEWLYNGKRLNYHITCHLAGTYSIEFAGAGDDYSRCMGDVPCESILIEDIHLKKRTRHKFPKPDDWVQNRRKKLRQEGKSYVTRRGILMPEKQFSIKECSHCPLKCHEFFNADELKEMFDNFWKMDLQNKRQYLSQLVEETGVKRVRTKSAQSRRSLTRHYYLIKNATQKKKVCRSFFMEVFKVSSNFIRTVCRKRLKSGIVEKDLRGKCPPSNKRPAVARDLIRNHVNQFRRPQSNAKAGDREYLPSSLTLKSMYNSYVLECEKKDIQPEKYWLYADIFHKDFNLHFRKTAKSNETVVVKLSTDEVSKESNAKTAEIADLGKGITLNESAVINVNPNDPRISLCSPEATQNSVVDYKTLYEEEVRKNTQLQKEIQKLTLMLRNNNGKSNYLR